MPQPSSFRQNPTSNRCAAPLYLAIVLSAIGPFGCQQKINKQPDPIAPQPAPSGSSRAPTSPAGGNSAGNVETEKDKCLVPGPFQPYFANEEAFVFKSTPDTDPRYYDPSICKKAPFESTFSAGGRMTSVLYRLDDATVGHFEQRELGFGTLCFKVQDPAYTPFGPPMLAYGSLKLNGKSFMVNGSCTITNSALPVAGVSQMVCALPLVAPIPAGYAGGLLTTNSVLNMGKVPGLSGGSILALHLYQGTPPPSSPSASAVPPVAPPTRDVEPLVPERPFD